eukprot:3807331-Amphidinium_carterae.1
MVNGLLQACFSCSTHMRNARKDSERLQTYVSLPRPTSTTLELVMRFQDAVCFNGATPVFIAEWGDASA